LNELGPDGNGLRVRVQHSVALSSVENGAETQKLVT